MSTVDYIYTITDSTTTITLTSTPYTFYSGGDGSGGRSSESLAETYAFVLTDGSIANNIDEINSLNRLLKQAEDAQFNHTLAKVYITWQATTGGASWRSEIKKGWCDPGPDALLAGWWKNNITFVQVYLERVNYWEGAEVQCTLTNGNGTDDTTGLKVYSCADGSGASPNNLCNYVAINAAEVTGNLPAATRLEFTNTYSNGTDLLMLLWIGQSWSITDYANFAQILEGEVGVNVPGLMLETDDANASNAHFGALGPIIAGTNTDVTWAIATAAATALRGGRYHVMGHFRNTTLWTGWADTKILIQCGRVISNQYLDSSTTVAIRDLGAAMLPASLAGQATVKALSFLVRFTNNTASSITVPIDYFALMPADGWRSLKVSAATNERVVDDGINDIVYTDTGAGAAKVEALAVGGAPIMLRPNTDQRLYFMFHSNSSVSARTMTATVKLYFRPRKLTI